MKNKMPKSVRFLLTCVLVFAVVLIALYSVYRIWEAPPEKGESPLSARALPPEGEPSPAPTAAEQAAATEEPGGVYTLLGGGKDDGHRNHRRTVP